MTYKPAVAAGHNDRMVRICTVEAWFLISRMITTVHQPFSISATTPGPTFCGGGSYVRKTKCYTDEF
jgi:hypothetical protein